MSTFETDVIVDAPVEQVWDVLANIGAPDFIGGRVWEYVMDDPKPYTMIVSWGKDGVKATERHRPSK